MNKRFGKPVEQKAIALERIKHLFREASLVFNDDAGLSNRYVELARKLSSKNKVKIPSVLKRRFCKKCGFFLVPSKNCSVRLHNSNVVYHCENCNNFMRFSYVREQKLKRKKKV